MKIVNKIQIPVTIELCEAIEKARCQLVMSETESDYVLHLETEAGAKVMGISKAKATAPDLYIFKQMIESMCYSLSDTSWVARDDLGQFVPVFTAPRLVVGTRTVREFYAEVDRMVLGVVVSSAAAR